MIPVQQTTHDGATDAPAARGRGLTKVYGAGDTEVVALDHVDVDFRRGEFTAIMGPSGSGKSTLMHCMAGLDALTSGQAWIGGTELSGLDDKRLTTLRRDKVGFVFQAFNLLPTLSASGRGWATGRASCPAASSSASRAPARWRAGPTSSSPTSRRATSTRAAAPPCSPSCGCRCASSARPSSW